MDPTGTVTPESFSLIHLFLHADWVLKGVLLGLGLASLWSWAVIIDKFIRLSALNRQANLFEDQVSSGKALEDVAAAAGEAPRHALPRMMACGSSAVPFQAQTSTNGKIAKRGRSPS